MRADSRELMASGITVEMVYANVELHIDKSRRRVIEQDAISAGNPITDGRLNHRGRHRLKAPQPSKMRSRHRADQC